MNEFTEFTDLAAEHLGGEVLYANDEFFAEKENLLKEGRGIYLEDEYTDRGKWMDGWESRRKREPGHDFCIIKLGLPGQIHGVDIDTNHFVGNFPEFASLEALCIDGEPGAEDLLSEDIPWTELLPISRLKGGSQNLFEIPNNERWTHLKFHIYPDGGVARLRIHGQAQPDWAIVLENNAEINLTSLALGAKVEVCNDSFFSPKDNLIKPTKPLNMRDGWETRRRREPGNDWVVVKLAAAGHLSKIEVDTAFFKGNYPDSCSIEGCFIEREVPSEYLATASFPWFEILPKSKLQADHNHIYESEIQEHDLVTHLRLHIYPDGGISRLRVFGQLTGFEKFNRQGLELAYDDLERCCGSSNWLAGMLSLYPYSHPAEVKKAANAVWAQMGREDILEAFQHHPKIGDINSLKEKFASTANWASGEQSGTSEASEDTLKQLAEGNQKYEDKFGYIFIVCATGKSAQEMLDLLNSRLPNAPEEELAIAAEEQRKITQLRLEKLFS